MWIWRVPVTASVKLASTDALVSNASLKLQHAALQSSWRLSCWMLMGSSSDTLWERSSKTMSADCNNTPGSKGMSK